MLGIGFPTGDFRRFNLRSFDDADSLPRSWSFIPDAVNDNPRDWRK